MMTEVQGLTELQMLQEGDTDVIVRRDFRHPPASVWEAMTRPEHIRNWLSNGEAMLRCEVDLRPGGMIHYEWPDFFFQCPILSVDAPHRLVCREHFNGDSSKGPVVTTELSPNAGGTRMTILMRYASAAERAEAMEMGMLDGYDVVYARLDGLLTTA